jgi:predicted ATPase/DNA-binding XRE family transcriptional regulator
MTETRTAFGRMLRRLRSAASLSQEELAERAGLSKRGISDLERGARLAPRLETVRLLADALMLSDVDRQALLAAARPGLLRTEGSGPVPSVPVSLPTPLTRLIGREKEVRVLESSLRRDDIRLVTLTGAGGTGKTRLAIAVAAELQDAFPDGIVFVDLAPLTDPGLVLPTIAATLGVRETESQSLRVALEVFLAAKRLLLVCDNYEHLLAAATIVSDLLRASPTVKALVTSRESLRLRGEWEVAVAPLAVPGAEQNIQLADLESVPAVALFMQRATAAKADFDLTTENAAAISEIVRRLDGLPLAIELAAAWVKLLTPEALRTRLDRRLPLLTGGPRDAPQRQRTLRDTIAWSHDLLGPSEQVLFRRLGLFVGGWTIKGSEVVSALDAEQMIDPLLGIGSLLGQSLIKERPSLGSMDAEPRYDMLETIRDFAVEQLVASGELAAIERTCEEFFLGLAEVAEAGLHGPDQLLWLGRLEAEHDNCRAAMGRALDRGDGAIALKLALRLWEFWETRGYRGEGRAWLERTLASAGTVDERDRAAAEFAMGRLSFDLGDYDAAVAHYQKSLESRRQLGDVIAEAEVLSALAMIAVNRLAYDEANGLGEEALKISRQRGDGRRMASALRVLGMIAREQGEYEHALGLFEESIGLGRALGDAAWTARVASQIGITHRLAGDIDQAQRFLDTSRKLHSEIGDRFALGVIASHQGHLAFDAGDIDRAIMLYAEALRHFDAVSDSEAIVEGIEWLAVSAAANGKAVPALRLFGAAATAREALRLPPRLEGDETRVASGLDQAMRAAGPGAREALAIGRTLSLDEGRDEALELAGVGANLLHAIP